MQLLLRFSAGAQEGRRPVRLNRSPFSVGVLSAGRSGKVTHGCRKEDNLFQKLPSAWRTASKQGVQAEVTLFLWNDFYMPDYAFRNLR